MMLLLERKKKIPHHTHAVRSEYPAVPLPHEYVRAVDEAVRYAHVAHVAVLELLEELEVAGGDDDLACG